LHLGATVEELQARMSSGEFARWIAYFCLEPFGYEVENWRMGTIAATVANVSPGRKGKALVSADFCPKKPNAAPAMSPRQKRQWDARQLAKKRGGSK
jgi:hypothetical protein